jgi:hypothetical protein
MASKIMSKMLTSDQFNSANFCNVQYTLKKQYEGSGDIHLFTHLSGCLGVVGIPRLFSPGTLHRLAIDIRVVDSHNRVSSGLLGRESAIIDPANIPINLLVSSLYTQGV